MLLVVCTCCLKQVAFSSFSLTIVSSSTLFGARFPHKLVSTCSKISFLENCSEFSRIFTSRSRSRSILISLFTSRKRVKAFCFHFALLEKEWKHFFFTLHFSKKSESIFFFTLHFSKKSESIFFHFVLLEKEWKLFVFTFHFSNFKYPLSLVPGWRQQVLKSYQWMRKSSIFRNSTLLWQKCCIWYEPQKHNIFFQTCISEEDRTIQNQCALFMSNLFQSRATCLLNDWINDQVKNKVRNARISVHNAILCAMLEKYKTMHCFCFLA